IGAQLHIPEAGEVRLESRRPLTDRPVVPVAANEVAGLCATEGEVHEIAGEGCEIIAHGQLAYLPVEPAVEELLAIPELREPPGLAAAIQLLHLLQIAEVCILT